MLDPQKDIQEQVIAKTREDATFKQQLLTNPKATLSQELGQEIPDNVEIEVVQQTPNKLYLVLPLEMEQLPNQELAEQELETVAGGGTPAVVTATIVTGMLREKFATRTWPCK